MLLVKVTRNDNKSVSHVPVDEIGEWVKREFDNPLWIHKGLAIKLKVVKDIDNDFNTPVSDTQEIK